MEKQLIKKYNVPGPRYTSYPTVPYWKDNPMNLNEWKESVVKTFRATNKGKGISLYIHLPFCESLCHYCGCNVRHTTNHKVEDSYIGYVIKEWQLYLNLLPDVPHIAEIHLGGGTPTFFSKQNLRDLIEMIKSTSTIHPQAKMSFEADPRNTTREQLQTLYDLGFRRVSFGVQDFDQKVQEAINRIQPFDMVRDVTEVAREIGYESINYDLIYGLPHQQPESIEQTFNFVKEMMPERIAYYSYAHVPWMKGIQRKFSENDLPQDDAKRELYELGKTLLEKAGYIEIGMDHFALPNDELTLAFQNKTLYRNFMGYTTQPTELMIGLGSSSISDSWTAFGQNHKTIRNYQKLLDQNELPIFRGHLLNREDLVIRKHILNLMCQFETSWGNEELQHPTVGKAIAQLTEFEKDKLLEIGNQSLIVTDKGKPFIRNICMTFDAHLKRDKPKRKLFSKTV